ncbi:lysophospholipid acyltransferase family protein [Bifidobacterium magnum]|uniref:1-acyl-sn-glycerol-3-phosphate acyltransferase n=1 Tax=Bifidobacterium magnum TaxID=1692 RepID=A0A087BAX7_9BIFI|nr:lysophospholipid acyltransferase family protein [Bifidobacterium magnum]KFI68177.1 1-acyl-sn-glycerol-3-phosphate acyltransferase [Bifidobacterium magnum]
MASKGKPSPRSSVKPLSNERLAELRREHVLVDPTRWLPTGPRNVHEVEINDQNPKLTHRLLEGCARVLRNRCRPYAWGLDNIPERGPYICAATHVTLFDVFVPMCAQFQMGRRPRFMAKAEMASWPIIGKWFQAVGMQPVKRRSGQARAIEETSIQILTTGRPLTIWPEGTLTRDPQKWPMSMKNGVGFIALEASRRMGRQIPLYVTAVWGAASINQWWPWPRKNVVMAFDTQLDYSDLLADSDTWGDEPPESYADELARRIRLRMKEIMADIRGEKAPDTFYDYRLMKRVPETADPYVTPAERDAGRDMKA